IAFLGDQRGDLGGRGGGEFQRRVELLVAGGSAGHGDCYGACGGADQAPCASARTLPRAATTAAAFSGAGSGAAAVPATSAGGASFASWTSGVSAWIRRPVIIAPAAISTTL